MCYRPVNSKIESSKIRPPSNSIINEMLIKLFLRKLDYFWTAYYFAYKVHFDVKKILHYITYCYVRSQCLKHIGY